jgi:hypothetical protein
MLRARIDEVRLEVKAKISRSILPFGGHADRPAIEQLIVEIHAPVLLRTLSHWPRCGAGMVLAPRANERIDIGVQSPARN